MESGASNNTKGGALPFSLPVLFVATVVLYWCGLVLYRLYAHPLARFPGPSIAAATSWYEAYYEIVLNGQYSRQISKLHDRYGKSICFISLFVIFLADQVDRPYHSRHAP